MQVIPSSAEEKLGFDVIRRRLEGLVASAMGLDRLAGMRTARSLAWLRDELGRVAELQDAFRYDDPMPLDGIVDVRQVVRRLAPDGGFIGTDDLVELRRMLNTARRLLQYVEARSTKYPHLTAVVAHITPLPAIEERIGAIVDVDGAIRDDASPELHRLRRLIFRRRAELRETLENELRKAMSQGYATEEQPTIRSGRMVIPVRAEAKRKVQGFVHDSSATGQTVYIEPAACLDLNNEVRELEADERREVERILREVAAEIRIHLDAVRNDVGALAQVDLLQAKAHFANQLDAVVPALDEDGILAIHGARNPVLLLHFEQLRERDGTVREVVPLDLSLGDAFNTLVITGPNAGGKTVAMKTVGLLTLMLAYGLPVPVAPHSRFSLFHRLMVDIGDEQSIEEDLSTFSSHVSNLKRMLREADASTLVLIDEAGSGTDPSEGGALAQSVLERLTDAGARTIATTHHGTLKAFAHEHDGVENGSMEFDRTNLTPTYRFMAGVPGSSYAFDIAQRIGLDDAVLTRARSLVGEQKTRLEDLITAFEHRNRALQEQLDDAERTLKEATHEKHQYEGRARKLANERDEIRRQALDEAERIVAAANARVERTVREIKEAAAEREATQAARQELASFKEQLHGEKEQVTARQRSRPAPAEPPPRQTKRAARKRADRPVQTTGGPIHVGDQVILDDGTTPADVLEIDDGEAVLAFGSMRIRAALDRIRKVAGPRRQQVTVHQVNTGDDTGVPSLSAVDRIDLRGQRVEEALAAVTHLIDAALTANLSEVEILHGKGTGALRQAIHEYLGTRHDVAGYEEAPWNQGGAGVTIVRLR